MRRAYYAGAWTILFRLRDVCGSDEVSEDQGVEIMAGLEAECQAFFADIKAGRA